MALAGMLGLNMAFMMIAMAPFIPGMVNEFKHRGVTTEVLVGAGSPNNTGENFDPTHQHDNQDTGKWTFGGPAPNIALFGAHGQRVAIYNSGGWDKATTKIGPENTGHIQVPSFNKNNDETGEYMIMSGGGYDTICISIVQMTTPGLSDIYGFVPGEIAGVCNNRSKTDWPWYLSARSITVQDPASKETQTVRPKCLIIGSYGWVNDGKDKNGAKQKRIDPQVPYEGFQIHTVDFKQTNGLWQSWQNDSRQMCGSQARFTMYKRINEMNCPQIFMPIPQDTPIPIDNPTTLGCYPDHTIDDPFNDPKVPFDLAEKLYETTRRPMPKSYQDKWKAEQFGQVYARSSSPPPPGSSRSWKRDQTHQLRKRREEDAALLGRVPFHRQLVRSHYEDHSAVELCSDPATVGPHFYSEREGMFCETDTHELYGRCESVEEDGCFDVESERVRLRGEGGLKERDADADAEPAYPRVQRWGFPEEEGGTGSADPEMGNMRVMRFTA